MPASLYKSKAGEQRIMELYDRKVEELGFHLESRTVDTHLGPTHVLVAGPEGAPELVALHGLTANAPLTLEKIKPFASRYRIYAPDIPGQPNKSVRVRPPHSSLAPWLTEVMDALKLESPACMGISYGAYTLLRLAAVNPDRISKALLVAPGGIINVPLIPLTRKVVYPRIKYFFSPNRENVQQVIDPIFTEVTDHWLEHQEALMNHFRLAVRPLWTVSKKSLEGFNAPVVVLGAEDDIFFPGKAVVSKARNLIPNLHKAVILPGYKHVPPSTNLKLFHDQVEGFLEIQV